MLDNSDALEIVVSDLKNLVDTAPAEKKEVGD